MSEIVGLEVQSRSGRGSRASRKLRTEGIVPGNVFGHGQESKAIQVSADALRAVLNKGIRVVDLKLDGNSETALVSEVQWDTFGMHLIHADFMRVDANERVHVEVPVHLKGTAPGVVAGGILEQPLHTLSIECLAINIPKEILVKIGELEIGATIHVRELTDIPSGVTIQNDPDQVVLHIVEPRGDDEAGAGAVAGEPEVIGRPKADA